MSKELVSETLRKAIDRDERSIYRLACDAGTDAPRIRRFLSGERGLALSTVDLLCKALGLRLTSTKRAPKGD